MRDPFITKKRPVSRLALNASEMGINRCRLNGGVKNYIEKVMTKVSSSAMPSSESKSFQERDTPKPAIEIGRS